MTVTRAQTQLYYHNTKSNQKISITVSVSRNTNTTKRAVRILSIMRILVLVMNAMTESQYLHLKYTLAASVQVD